MGFIECSVDAVLLELEDFFLNAFEIEDFLAEDEALLLLLLKG
jgi:hypothetical protein